MQMRLEVIPGGTLSLNRIKDNVYYYQKVYLAGERKEICLDPSYDEHLKVIKELMEKKTIVHGLPVLKQNIKALEKCVDQLQPYHPSNYKYGDLLGKEYYLDDDVCLRDWMKKPEGLNPAYPEQRIHETKKGILVRSKSEVLIADALYDLGINYKYETVLDLGGEKKYPDFEILAPNNKLVWWEHLGLIDDPNYVVYNLRKLIEYAKHGIVLGKNLIITWETKEMPLTRSMINEQIRSFALAD